MSAAAATTLPVDPEKEGNVWCESCQQSLNASRAAAHLVSKKHTENAADPSDAAPDVAAAAAEKKEKTPKKASKGGKVPSAAADADADEDAAPPKKGGGKKAALGAAPALRRDVGLPRDPQKESNFWCGICQVSLTPTKAEGHLETARHKDNSLKTLTTAMKSTKIDGK